MATSLRFLRLRWECTSLLHLQDNQSRQTPTLKGFSIDFQLLKSRPECIRSSVRWGPRLVPKPTTGLRLQRRLQASAAAEVSGGLLPDELLANLRLKGVTIWEFYYDDSSDTYRLEDYGEEVRALQGYLMTTGHFRSEHGTTGYFGPDTQAALITWQKENGVEPASGVWGPLSRDKYRQLLAGEALRVGEQRERRRQPRSQNSSPPQLLPAAPSTSVSVSSTAPPASGGVGLPQGLVAAAVIALVALLAVVLRPRKEVPKEKPPDAQTTEELNRARSMLELDRTGGPQPGDTGKPQARPS